MIVMRYWLCCQYWQMRLDLERGVSWRVLCMCMCVAFLQSQQWRTWMSSIPRRKWWRRQCRQPCRQRQWYWHCLFLWWEWASFLYLHGKFWLILHYKTNVKVLCWLAFSHYTLSYTLGWPTGCFIYFPVALHIPNLAYLTLYYNFFCCW